MAVSNRLHLIITGGQNARHRPAMVLEVEAVIVEDDGNDAIHNDESVEATGTESSGEAMRRDPRQW